MSEVKLRRRAMQVRVEDWVSPALDRLTDLMSAEVGARLTKGQALERLISEGLRSRGLEVAKK